MTGLTVHMEPNPDGARPRFRLSHSTNDILKRCERKFQLMCLIPSLGEDQAGMYADLPFGTSVGTGIQEYIRTGDLDKAFFAGFMAYSPVVEDDPKKYSRKYIERAMFCIEAMANKWDTLPYRLLEFNGQPAIEVSFKIVLNEHGDYYCGHMDAAIWNEEKDLPGVIEIKTTGMSREDLSPLYKFSPQATGYSSILDVIMQQETNNFESTYFVAHLIRGSEWPDIKVLPYQKTRLDRMNWMMTVIMDLKHAIDCYENNFWPQRFQECLAYNRPCQYLETCNLSSWNDEQEAIGNEFGMSYNAKTDWQFEFNLKDIFEHAL